MTDVTIPNNWAARPHQVPFMESMLVKGIKRALCVWHRRAGKDSASLNFTAIETQKHPAVYWHMLPTAIQARHVVWDAIDPRTGVRVIDQVFPKEMRKSINHTEMKIELKNGAIWQCVGSDNYDRLVGANPRGVVFSEYSLSDPRAWDFIRPILAENEGWALFIYTFRGKNHGYDLYKMAKNNPEWFCEKLDIDHTFRDNERTIPVITKAQYQAEIEAGMDPQLALQEFYCDPNAGLFGAYFTEELKHAKIGEYPWNPSKPVHTFWDIGINDDTAIWFAQENESGDAINLIDYETANNLSFVQWIGILRNKPYNYGVNVKPHDFKKRDWKDGKSAVSVADDNGWDYEMCPDLPLRQGIDAVKMMLPRVRFNNTAAVMKGRDSIVNYVREYNDKLKIFLDHPAKGWFRHGTDAFRYLSIAFPFNYFAGVQNIQAKTSLGTIKRVNNGDQRMHRMMRAARPIA